MWKHCEKQLSRHRAALALLLLETLVFFHSLLFSSQWTIPWDFQGYHFPLFSFVAHTLNEGRMPWWDPFTNGGNPFYANPQTQLFYPPAWPFYLASHWIPEPRWAELYKWLPVLHVWLGGYFAWRLGRAVGLGGAASFAAGTVFAFGAFFPSQLQHVGAVCAAAWLPLAWEAAMRRRPALLALALGMSLLAGFPAMAIVVWGSTL